MGKWVLVLAALLLAGCGKDISPKAYEVAEASQDGDKYREEFAKAAQEMLKWDQCSLDAMVENGGFWKAVDGYNRNAYFIHCSHTMNNRNRRYLDPDSGRISMSN